MITLRIQAREGTKRLQLSTAAETRTLYEQIRETYGYTSCEFKLHKDKSKSQLVTSKSTTISQAGLNHGDLLFLTPEDGVELLPPTPTEDASMDETPPETSRNGLPDPSEARNDYPIPGILPEHTFVLIREITSRIEVHQVRERMVEGLQFSNQFVLGGAIGWMSAYLIKNFGKTALTAAGGGVLIMAVATRNGFIEVNWNRVFLELQKRGGTPPPPDSKVSTHAQGQDEGVTPETSLSIGEDWTVEKIQKAKSWIFEHSVAAVGFTSGFLYSVL